MNTVRLVRDHQARRRMLGMKLGYADYPCTRCGEYMLQIEDRDERFSPLRCQACNVVHLPREVDGVPIEPILSPLDRSEAELCIKRFVLDTMRLDVAIGAYCAIMLLIVCAGASLYFSARALAFYEDLTWSFAALAGAFICFGIWQTLEIIREELPYVLKTDE